MSLDKNLLESAPVNRVFIKYMLPCFIMMIFFALQSIVDAFIVGNHLGSDALAGMNLIYPLYLLIMALALTIGVGSQTVISMELGYNNSENAQNMMSTGFRALVGLSLIIMLFLLLLAEPLTKVMGADERMLPFSLAYLKGLVPFILPLTLCFYSDAMLRALGRPLQSMFIMLLSIVLKILFSFYLVVGLDWGTTGASMSTGIASTIGLLISASITFNPKQQLSMLKGRFDPSLLRRAFYNGLSEGASEAAVAFNYLIVNNTMSSLLGADGVAAFTVISHISSLGVALFLGISDSLIPVLSYNYGAKNYERVKQLFCFAVRINMGLGIIIFIALQLFGNQAILLFLNSSKSQVFQIAYDGLYIFVFVFLVNGVNFLIIAYFTALGQAKISLIIALLRGVVFMMIGLTVLPIFIGITGVWVTILLADFLALAVALILLYRTRKNCFL